MAFDVRAVLPAEGATIGGKYRVERVIGAGGMGVVYEATHVRIGQRVAIKMLHPNILEQPDLVARFEREARAAGQLRSPHAAKVIDVDATADGLPYLVMELLEGHDVEAELKARGRLPVDEAVGLVLEACEAMAAAHAMGIVHRDLKPSNLFLAREGTRVVVKVLDFGISKMVAAEAEPQVTSTLATMGTPLYMSPEQVRSAKNVDGRADVWSLGVILFELLTGRPPFMGANAMSVSAAIVADPAPRPRDLQPDVPEALEQVVLRALAKAPEARWADVRAFAGALVPFAGERRASMEPVATGRAVPSGAPASPSLAIAPTLAAAATPPQATPAPNVTARGWSSAAGPARASSRRVALLTGIVVLPLALTAAVAVVQFRGTRRPPSAPAVSAAPVSPDSPPTSAPASSDSAPVAALAPSVASAPSASARPLPRPPAPPPHSPAKPPPSLAPTTATTSVTNPVRL